MHSAINKSVSIWETMRNSHTVEFQIINADTLFCRNVDCPQRLPSKDNMERAGEGWGKDTCSGTTDKSHQGQVIQVI